MASKKRVLIFFVSLICILYTYGVLHGLFYQAILDDVVSVSLEKTSFFDVNDPSRTIVNRELSQGEPKVYKYKSTFKSSDLKALKLSVQRNESIYLMIEKPDVQYFTVQINDQTIGSYGEESGHSNIWNGTYFFTFNENIIEENNEITILMYSDYMTGVAGNIKLFDYEHYRQVESIINLNQMLIDAAIVIAFIVAAIICLIVIAWYKTLYNIRVYVYFLISIILIGISLIDFRVSQFISMDYLMFKKMIIISYHGAVTFMTLGVATLVNAKIKFNIGMLSFSVVVILSYMTKNMITWRDYYQVLNVFLIITIIQLIGTLIYYRKRALYSAILLIIAFSLGALSVGKLVYITSTAQPATMLIDMPILIAMFASVVLFVFYNEMTQMVDDGDMPTDLSISLNGAFSIDDTLIVTGAYTTTCDTIFNQFIVGKSLKDLMSTYEDFAFVEDILKEVFNTKHDYVEGFLDLMPSEIKINDRDYQVYYKVYDRMRRLLKITLGDITKSKALEKQINEERELQKFFINSLKSKQELSYFINKTQIFIQKLRVDGFTLENQKIMHTLKGNLAQFGFLNFEKVVHEVESALQAPHEPDELIDMLELNLGQSIDLLEKHIGKDFITRGYDQYVISKDKLKALEKSYLDSGQVDQVFLKNLRNLSYIDIKVMISRYVLYVEEQAEKLQKAVMPLEILGDTVLVQPEKGEKLVMSLVGIFRNALSHGIETPEERVSKGKDSFGKITCSTHVVDDILHLSIEEDGRGLDTKVLLDKAIRDGIVGPDDNLTEKEVLNLVFKDKMTTKEEADVLSGRGVGLSAIYDIITSIEGTIELESKLGKGSKFLIKVPMKCLID